MDKTIAYAYRKDIGRAKKEDDQPRVRYAQANLKLERLRSRAARGIVPTEQRIESARIALAETSANANADNLLRHYRSRLLGTWVTAIAYSDMLSAFIEREPFSERAINHAAQVLELEGAADGTAELLHEALEVYDSLPEGESSQRQDLTGFINETTLVLLGAMPSTAEQFIVPTTHWSDSLEPNHRRHADVAYYDNRKKRGHTVCKTLVQVKSQTTRHHPDYWLVPVVDARDMGNIPKSPRWPKDDGNFTTARYLVAQRLDEGGIDDKTTSTLQSIRSHVLDKIIDAKPSRAA